MRRQNHLLALLDRSRRMPTQCLENYDRKGTGGSAKRRTTARDEYAFLGAAKRGDSAAFEILCKQSADTVFRVARRITRSNEDAEDVVQESFQLAFIHLKGFKAIPGFQRGCPALPSMLP